MNTSAPNPASFARGFFLFLESRWIRYVILHGGEAGFDGGISDIDFAVGREDFPGLDHHIRDYCRSSSWRLCQILRHETTAAYFICSSLHHPEVVVALDACSDYQRNGVVYLGATELLENRRPLPWGGHGLKPEWELRYRFSKAAAKNKDPESAAAEFASYPPEARQDCARWLSSSWSVIGVEWTGDGLATAFRQLLRSAMHRRYRFDPAALGRRLLRVLHPTGLIVEHGGKLEAKELLSFAETAGRLYFRHHRVVSRWKARFLRDLVSSTLILVPKLPFIWHRTLPAGCILRIGCNGHPMVPLESLAGFLQGRCAPSRHVP